MIVPEHVEEMKKLVVNWTALNKLSKEAIYLFYSVGKLNKMIMYGQVNCYLAKREINPEVEPIEREFVDELRASYFISPLSQFTFNNRVGWRELCGEVGEKFDIYVCTQ